MCINTFVPVEEALNVDNVARLKLANCCINSGVGIGEVTLYAEAVLSTVLGKLNVNIVAGFAVFVFNGYNSHFLELNELVLVLYELLGAEKRGNVGCFSNPGKTVVYKLKRTVHDLDLACPSTLVAGDLYLGSLGELCSISLGACKLVCKVCSVGILKVNGDLVVPPGLSSLNVSLDNYLVIDLSCVILCVGHNARGFCGIVDLGLARGLGSACSSVCGSAGGRSYRGLCRSISRSIGRFRAIAIITRNDTESHTKN